MAEKINPELMPDLVGDELDPSPWLLITQERVNQFAESTNDRQFIHVDVERASATPFEGTIAHGFLTLSLLVYLNSHTMKVPKNLATIINYGSDKIRYLTPVRVGRRIRSHQKILDVTEKHPGNWLVKTAVSVEVEGETKPAMVAEILMMFICE